MAKTFVLGDIHGAYKALQQVLKQAAFDHAKDTLIQLGDVTDGWPDVYQCVEELLSIKHLIAIKGNHDIYFREFITTGVHPRAWKGCEATLNAYAKASVHPIRIEKTLTGISTDITPGDITPAHQHFFKAIQRLYYVDDQHRLFIHAGFNRRMPLALQAEEVVCWDRKLWSQAMSFESTARGNMIEGSRFKMEDDFSEVFIGHTPTLLWGQDTPMHAANIWNLDTGAGWDGKLTMMDVNTGEYWQSDRITELYPNEQGRIYEQS